MNKISFSADERSGVESSIKCHSEENKFRSGQRRRKRRDMCQTKERCIKVWTIADVTCTVAYQPLACHFQDSFHSPLMSKDVNPIANSTFVVSRQERKGRDGRIKMI